MSAKRLIIIIMHVVELGQQFCDGRHVAYFMSLCFTYVIQYTTMDVRIYSTYPIRIIAAVDL